MSEASHVRLVHESAQDELEGFQAELPGGLPVYQNPSIEGVESTWAHIDSKDDKLNLERGAVAHAVSLQRVYGEADLRQFAGKVGAEYSTVLDWMATYRRLLRLSDARRERVMNLDRRYSHYRCLNGVQSDERYEALLQRSNKKRWSVGKTLDALYEMRRADDQGLDTFAVSRPNEPTTHFQGILEMGPGHYQTVKEFADEKEEATAARLRTSDEYAKQGADVDVSPPQPPKIEQAELDSVGKDYERDVIERFTDWCADEGMVLADADGAVRKFYVEVERYARERL